jgi:hypothetical protein
VDQIILIEIVEEFQKRGLIMTKPELVGAIAKEVGMGKFIFKWVSYLLVPLGIIGFALKIYFGTKLTMFGFSIRKI